MPPAGRPQTPRPSNAQPEPYQVTADHIRELVDGDFRDPLLILHPLSGQVGIYEIGDADTLHGIVLAVPAELEDRRLREHDGAWYTEHARLINNRIEFDGYGPSASALTIAGRART